MDMDSRLDITSGMGSLIAFILGTVFIMARTLGMVFTTGIPISGVISSTTIGDDWQTHSTCSHSS